MYSLPPNKLVSMIIDAQIYDSTVDISNLGNDIATNFNNSDLKFARTLANIYYSVSDLLMELFQELVVPI